MLDDTRTLIPDPAWPCGMPRGIPGPATGRHAFDIDFDPGALHDLGTTPFGKRRRLQVRGGTVDGENMRGAIKAWGVDYELTLDNGVTELEQLHVLQLGGETVFMHNYGVALSPDGPTRVVLDFEASKDGPHAFLNDKRYVATREHNESLGLWRMNVYELTASVDLTDPLRITRPPGRPPQSVDCQKSAGARGPVLFQGDVSLAGYWSVGESKRGTRNMIPIVSGHVSGKLEGRILPGGADYQLQQGDALTLDARYVLELSDGERVLVRNCGAVGALVPTFEARADGPYGWLNGAAYLSADPNPKADLTGIELTVYQVSSP